MRRVKKQLVKFLTHYKTDRIGFKILCCGLHIGTFCGVFRRQALDRGAMALKVDKIVTG